MRRYEPIVRYERHGSMEPYPDMEECKGGQWVRLQTYVDRVRQLEAQLDRLSTEAKQHRQKRE